MPAKPASAFFACHALQRVHRLGDRVAEPQHRPRPALRFRIGVEERAGLGAERGFFGRVVEVHASGLSLMAALRISSSSTSRFFQHGAAAERQRELLRSAIIQVAIHIPGEADAAMGLDVFLRREMERLGRRHARGRRGQRQFGRIRRQRPGTVIRIRARQFDRDIDVGELVLDRLERADRPAERVTLHARSCAPSRSEASAPPTCSNATRIAARSSRRCTSGQPRLRAKPLHLRAGEVEARVIAAGIDRGERCGG